VPRLIDISQPLGARTAVWPGDRPVTISWTMRRSDGDAVNVAAIAGTVHAGTHIDAPLHFHDDGAVPADLPLDAFVGPALVIDIVGRDVIDETVLPAVDAARGRGVAGELLAADESDDAGVPDLRMAEGGRESGGAGAQDLGLAGARLLFRTRARVNAREFPAAFAAFDPGFARRLAAAGVRLVGTDAPSVDTVDSKTLDAHRAFAAGGVAILENVVLDDLAPGPYVLIALPLKLVEADSSPTRAVLLDGVAWPEPR